MMTWDDVHAFLDRTLPPSDRDATGVRLDIRGQHIRISPGGAHLLIGTAVGSTATVTSRTALACAYDTGLGGLILSGELYVLRHCLPLAGLTEELLLRGILTLADEGRALRHRLLSASAAAVAPFAAYCD